MKASEQAYWGYIDDQPEETTMTAMKADIFMGDYWEGQSASEMMLIADDEGIDVIGGIDEVRRIMAEVKDSIDGPDRSDPGYATEIREE